MHREQNYFKGLKPPRRTAASWKASDRLQAFVFQPNWRLGMARGDFQVPLGPLTTLAPLDPTARE